MISKELANEKKAAMPKPLKRYAEVTAVLDGGQYQVRDDQGRLANVDADSSWIIGDSVTIQNDRIVGRATKFIQAKVFKI